MHPGEDKLAKELGDWMKINSEAVYGVKYAGLSPSKYGYFTRKNEQVYLTVFNRPVNNIVRIAIDKKATEIPASASLLINGQSLVLKRSDIGLDLDKNAYFDVILPKDFQSDKPFVIKISTVKGDIKTDKLMDAKM